jgi:ribosomal protein S4
MIGLRYSQQQQKKRIKKKKQTEYGIIRQIKLRYAAKAMNGKVPQEKLTTSLKRSHLLPTSSGLQPFEVIVITNQSERKIRPISWNQI